MSEPTERECLDAWKVNTYLPYQIALSLEILYCSTGIIISLYVLANLNYDLLNVRKRLALKTLLWVGILHDIAKGGVEAYQLFHALTNGGNPCGLVYSNVICSKVRVAMFLTTLAMCSVQVTLLYECILCLLPEKNKILKMSGVLVDVGVTSLPFFISAFIYSHENLAENLSNCMVLSLSTAEIVKSLFYSYIVCDLISLTLFILLLFVNHRILQRSRFRLTDQFRLRENGYTMKLIIPQVFVHLVIFGIYTTGNVVTRYFVDISEVEKYRATLAFLFIPPVYTIIAPICLLFTQKKLDRDREKRIKVEVIQKNEIQSYIKQYQW